MLVCGGFYGGVVTRSFMLVLEVAGAGFCGGALVVVVFFVGFQILRRCC